MRRRMPAWSRFSAAEGAVLVAKRQTRKSVSVRGTTYDRLRAWCAARSISMSEVVEEGIAARLDATPAPASSPRVVAAIQARRPPPAAPAPTITLQHREELRAAVGAPPALLKRTFAPSLRAGKPCECCGRSAAKHPSHIQGAWCEGCLPCAPRHSLFGDDCGRRAGAGPSRLEQLRARAAAPKKETPCSTISSAPTATVPAGASASLASTAPSTTAPASSPAAAAPTAPATTSPRSTSTSGAKPAARSDGTRKLSPVRGRTRCTVCGGIALAGAERCAHCDRQRVDLLVARPVTQIDPAVAELQQRQAERVRQQRGAPIRLEIDKPTPAPMPRAAGNVIDF
jgi:hypothetical protein